MKSIKRNSPEIYTLLATILFVSIGIYIGYNWQNNIYPYVSQKLESQLSGMAKQGTGSLAGKVAPILQKMIDIKSFFSTGENSWK